MTTSDLCKKTSLGRDWINSLGEVKIPQYNHRDVDVYRKTGHVFRENAWGEFQPTDEWIWEIHHIEMLFDWSPRTE